MKISITKTGIEHKKILVLINPWMAPINYYNNLPKNLGIINAYYSDDILYGSPEKVRSKVWKFVNTLERSLKFKDKELYLYAQSLGTCFAMMIADKVLFKKVTLIVPGDNLAKSFWDGDLTQPLKNNIMRKGYTRNKLVKAWKDISPDYYFKKLGKKPEYIIKLSKNDKTIPIKRGKNLVKILKSKKIKSEVEYSNLSHSELCIRDKDKLQ